MNIKKIIAVMLSMGTLFTFIPSLSALAADLALDHKDWTAFVEEKIEQDSTPGLAVTLVNGSEVSYKNWG